MYKTHQRADLLPHLENVITLQSVTKQQRRATVTAINVKKTVVYTRVNGASHIENCKNYEKVITHQHIA